MDKQKTPKQSKRSSRQTQTQTPPPPPTTLSSAGSYIPQMPSPTYHAHNTDWIIPPSAAIYDPNFFNTNPPTNYGMSRSNFLPFMHGQSFTGMLSQSTPMPSQPTPMPSQSTPMPSQSMPNLNEPRDNAESSPEWEDDVPETQPETTPSPPPPPSPGTSKGKRKGKGKGKAKEPSEPSEPNDDKKFFEDRAAPKMWTPDEEIELAKAWVTTSEDSVVGNNRSKVDFWGTIKKRFEQRMGCPPDYRSVHQIRSKCVTMGGCVTKFSNIYNNVRSARKSGEGDGDWLTKARFRYQEENKKPFKHEHVWEVLKGCEKYMRTPLLASTRRPKRSKTSESGTPTDTSSAHGPFNVDDEDENEDHDEEEEERPRPMGRNAARSYASGSTGGASTDRVSGLVSELSTLNYQNRELLDQRRKDFDLRERDLRFREAEAEEKRERRDYKFYVSSHAHLSGGALLTTLSIKEKLRQKYGWPPLE